jgi:hypothetical protein
MFKDDTKKFYRNLEMKNIGPENPTLWHKYSLTGSPVEKKKQNILKGETG